MRQKSRGLYEGLVSFVGVAAFFAGIAPLFRLPASLQWMLVGGAIAIGLVALAADIISGTPTLVAVVKPLSVCVLVGGLLFGVGRYFASMAASDNPLTTY